jgi:hypothetical protein
MVSDVWDLAPEAGHHTLYIMRTCPLADGKMTKWETVVSLADHMCCLH